MILSRSCKSGSISIWLVVPAIAGSQPEAGKEYLPYLRLKIANKHEIRLYLPPSHSER